MMYINDKLEDFIINTVEYLINFCLTRNFFIQPLPVEHFYSLHSTGMKIFNFLIEIFLNCFRNHELCMEEVRLR